MCEGVGGFRTGVSRPKSEANFLRRRAEQAWRLRWGAPRAFASSLLDFCPSGADGPVLPVNEVVQEFRHTGLVE